MTLDTLLREQLYAAFKKKKWHLDGLRVALLNGKPPMKVDGPALSRKLRGLTGMSLEEYRALANVLGVRLSWNGRKAS